MEQDLAIAHETPEQNRNGASQLLTISCLVGSRCTWWVCSPAVEAEVVVDIAGAVAGLTMSSCWVCSDCRSARGNGVGIVVVSRESGD